MGGNPDWYSVTGFYFLSISATGNFRRFCDLGPLEPKKQISMPCNLWRGTGGLGCRFFFFRIGRGAKGHGPNRKGQTYTSSSGDQAPGLG